MTITVSHLPDVAQAQTILSAEALGFVAKLHQNFGATRDAVLAQRVADRKAAAIAGGLDFNPATSGIRNGDWKVAEAPAALRDRRVEITGPASPAKMAINALNSGAKVWLADLEDASTPTWCNVIDALANLGDATRGTLAHEDASSGKSYALRTDAPLAVVVVRPRGWHLPEDNVLIDGAPAIGALVDFGLHFFHNARVLSESGQGPFYYLPKMESAQEAALWNQVFAFAEKELGIEHGTVRATMLIETIPAAFQMDEMLYELRDYASGLNAGRWDYLFSIIKYFRTSGEKFIMPDRADVAMTAPMMRAYTDLLVATCHKRGAFAMGGMAAVIPNRREPEVTEAAFAKVRADKTREAGDGFDGSWVAHPDLVSICREVFDSVLGDRPNQVDRQRPEVNVNAGQLLDVPSAPGSVTEAGVRANLYVAVAYTAAWLSGNGAVAIHNLMEDAATAEISRSQIWQQIRNQVIAADTGNKITAELVAEILAEEVEKLRSEVADDARFARFHGPAAALIGKLVSGKDEDFEDFLTLPAYRLLSHELVTQP